MAHTAYTVMIINVKEILGRKYDGKSTDLVKGGTLIGIRCEGLDSIFLAQDRDLRLLPQKAKILWPYERRTFLIKSVKYCALI